VHTNLGRRVFDFVNNQPLVLVFWKLKNQRTAHSGFLGGAGKGIKN